MISNVNVITKENVDIAPKIITTADAVKQLVKIKSKSEQLKALEKHYEEIVKAAMGDNDKLEIAGHIISYSRYTEKRLDWTALKLEEPELYQKYVRENERRRFSIK